MPTTITPYQLLVWLAVGFFTAVGWATGVWLVGRILGVFINGAPL